MNQDVEDVIKLNDKIKFMKEAYKEALKAYDKKEVPVGCVIVKDGKIISKAHNLRETKQDVTKHAELIAISKACKKLNSWRLDDCDLYCTLEPCIMCYGAIVNARIKNLYISSKNQRVGISGETRYKWKFPRETQRSGGEEISGLCCNGY